MNKEIILQKVIENRNIEWSDNIGTLDFKTFGLDWKLFDYQQEALENTIKLLFLYFKEGKEKLYKLYKAEGLDSKFEEDNLFIWKDKDKDIGFELLKDYFETKNDVYIEFIELINRASYWMATGSGKTLVMVKLIELLYRLMQLKIIPLMDIMFLAPRDGIINQMKYHIDIFNKRGELFIDFVELRRWESEKSDSLFSNYIKVFYYRADNITEDNKDKQIDYKSFENNGKWYVLLDEAHKGEKATSKRQQYFSIFSRNGFLFNFSATFTDIIDIVTTIYDFKLDVFLKQGYGKKIYIANSEFIDFRPIKQNKILNNDFNEDERKNIILKTLILLATAKKHSKKLKNINSGYYHSPLLVTVANSVNTDEADLKIFYVLLAEIALRKIDFKVIKQKLVEELKNNNKYAIEGLGDLDDALINKIEKLSETEFLENVFNTKRKGNIEVIRFKNNTREIAFKIKGANKYFGLICASDIIKWQGNVLEGFEISESVEEGIFGNINERDDINILLGSRIFVEGWDSNRPNIINFINIGVDTEAKKFVLQTIGRGLRIEPIKGYRKRFDTIKDKEKIFKGEDISKIHQNKEILENLFVFATNKQVIQNIIKELEKQSEKWVIIKNIIKNPDIKNNELPLYIPEYKEDILNDEPFSINKDDNYLLDVYIKKSGDKLLILKDDLNIRTINKLKQKENRNITGNRKNYNPEYLIKKIDAFWNKSTRKLKRFKILENEINHYKYIQTNLVDKLEQLEAEIKSKLQPSKYDSEEELDKLFESGEIDRKTYKSELKKLLQSKPESGIMYYKVLREHYYIPILLKRDLKNYKHIIKIVSEIDFINELGQYIKTPKNKLKNYKWWYFSKIDESIDEINLPYFDTVMGEYRNFCPDFIFWLKKEDKYYIKFIDPKGTEHTKNTSDKVKGFEKIKKEIEKIEGNIEDIELYFFNDNKPDSEFKKYWTNDFDKIF